MVLLDCGGCSSERLGESSALIRFGRLPSAPRCSRLMSLPCLLGLLRNSGAVPYASAA